MIEKSVLLRCAPDRAFALFTGRISEWWPPERRHTGGGGGVIVLSPAEGFFERGADGRVVALGAVLAWEPPRRLLLDWYPGTDPDHPTRVEIRFEPVAEGTRVVVEHGPTPASELLFPARAPRYAASWDLVLAALAGAAALDNR